jgi:regulatory protein
MESAVRLLSYRLRSEKELTDRLNEKGFDADLIRHAVRSLSEDGYLNDPRFARELSSSRLRNKHWGRLKIAAELRHKGIASEIIKTVLSDISEDEEKEAARLAFKKWCSSKSQATPLDKDSTLKAMRHLSARGFSLPVARQAINNNETE